MTTSDPGEVRDPRARPAEPTPGRSGRRLDEAPSARYAAHDGASGGPGDGGEGRVSVVAPLARAGVVAAIGAAALFVVGAVIASTVGLVFVCGVMGAGIGLLLAGAAVERDGDAPALTRGAVLRLAIGMALVAVLVADVATWLYALREGGTLGLVDYLLETFGPFVPGELLVAALGAVWGASSGPIRRS